MKQAWKVLGLTVLVREDNACSGIDNGGIWGMSPTFIRYFLFGRIQVYSKEFAK